MSMDQHVINRSVQVQQNANEQEFGRLQELSLEERGWMLHAACQTAAQTVASRRVAGLPDPLPAAWPDARVFQKARCRCPAITGYRRQAMRRGNWRPCWMPAVWTTRWGGNCFGVLGRVSRHAGCRCDLVPSGGQARLQSGAPWSTTDCGVARFCWSKRLTGIKKRCQSGKNRPTRAVGCGHRSAGGATNAVTSESPLQPGDAADARGCDCRFVASWFRRVPIRPCWYGSFPNRPAEPPLWHCAGDLTCFH